VEDFAASGIAACRNEFRSQDSHGIIPEAAEIGDVICVLGDSEIPFVLRPMNGRYELVGDAYVDYCGVDCQPKLREFIIQ
jgi:hypothetical protein